MSHFQEWVLETNCTLEQKILYHFRGAYAWLCLAEFEGMAEGSQPGEHVGTRNLLDLEGGKTRALSKWESLCLLGDHQRQSQLASKTHNIFSCSVCLEGESTMRNMSIYYPEISDGKGNRDKETWKQSNRAQIRIQFSFSSRYLVNSEY